MEWERFQTRIVERIKTYILCSVNVFPENRAIYQILWKNIAEPDRRQMTIWRMRVFMLDTSGYKHVIRICSTYCFSPTTMVAPTRLDVTLYVHWLSLLQPDVSVPSVSWQWWHYWPRARISLAQSLQLHGTPNHSGRPRRDGLYFIFCVEDILCVNVCSELSARSDQYYYWVKQRFSNCGPRTTSGPRVLPLWSFQIEH